MTRNTLIALISAGVLALSGCVTSQEERREMGKRSGGDVVRPMSAVDYDYGAGKKAW